MSKQIGGDIVTVLPDHAERYFTTSLMCYNAEEALFSQRDT